LTLSVNYTKKSKHCNILVMQKKVSMSDTTSKNLTTNNSGLSQYLQSYGGYKLFINIICLNHRKPCMWCALIQHLFFWTNRRHMNFLSLFFAGSYFVSSKKDKKYYLMDVNLAFKLTVSKRLFFIFFNSHDQKKKQ